MPGRDLASGCVLKLHTVFVTYNRLELTKQAIQSYLETVSVPFTYVVVDNRSEDGTREWILSEIPNFSLLNENRYPGFACNHGWTFAGEDVTHLHRADNDFAFLPGWCDRVQEMFVMKKIGQVGLRTDEEERNIIRNCGGNCVIRRELWDKGLRWDERGWEEYPPLHTEDTYFSPEVRRLGYTWKRVKEPCIVSLAMDDLADPYYQETYRVRRMAEGRVPL